MSRRDRNAGEPPLSLFSFQDIITCVTGILILITLLLSLDITNRASAPARSASASASLADAARELKSRVASSKAELEDLDRLTGMMSAGPVAVTPVQARQAEESVNQWRRVREELAVEVSVAEAAAVRTRRAIEADIGRRIAEASRQQQEIRNAIEASAGEAAHDRKEAEAARASVADGPLLVVQGAQGRQTPLVVAVRPDETIVARISPDGRPEVLNRFSGRGAEAALRAWAASRNSNREYFVLLVHPGAISEFEEFVEWAREKGFSVGIEPLAAEVDPFATPTSRPGRGSR